MQKLLAACCLAVIFGGSYSLKQTFDAMSDSRLMADAAEQQRILVQNSPRCVTTGHFERDILILPQGMCVLNAADIGDTLEIHGEGPEKTVVIYNYHP